MKDKKAYQQFGQHYQEEAASYDLRRSCRHEKLYEEIIKKSSLEFFGPNLSSVHCLEAGCGTGRFSLFFAEHGASVTALDYSQAMLSQTAKKVKKLNLKKFNLVLGDINHLPFKDASFDLVFSYGVLRHFSDPNRAIAEMCRVLKPGGRLVFDFLNTDFLKMSRWRQIAPLFFRRFASSGNGFYQNYLFSFRDLSSQLSRHHLQVKKAKYFIKFPSHLLLCRLKLSFLYPVIFFLENKLNWGTVGLIFAVKNK